MSSIPTIEVRYHSFCRMLSDCKDQLTRGGLLVRLDAQLERSHRVLLVLVAPDSERFELPARVLQVIPGQGLALEFPEADEQLISRLTDHAIRGKAAEPGKDNRPTEVRLVGESSASSPADSRTTQPVPAQVAQMTTAQKRQAALHGNKDLRWALIRDRNKTIHPFVIKNPAITLDEVEQIAKLPSVNPDVLRAIARNREWTRSVAVCRNLVRNPKTPLKEALQVLDKLPVSELRALARSSNVRTPIQQAARKKVIK